MKLLKKNLIAFFKGFKYAYDGIIYTFKSERNMKVHTCIMILVIAFGLIFGIKKTEWIICIILFGLVLAGECINTSIEILNNMMIRMNDEEKYIAAGHSKDTAAGAVLILAIAAAIIGLIIFIPHIIRILGR